MLMTTKKRRSFEADHFRKFLIVIDESPEMESALYYAASRMQRSAGTLVMLYVIVPQEFQHWINVRQQQIEEETAKAKALFRLMRRKLNVAGYENVACEEIVREGAKGEEIRKLIDEDEDIAVLVLGASEDAAGPGQLPDPYNHCAGDAGSGGRPHHGVKGWQGTRNPSLDRLS
jgi:nucleotide-binding universal stress UspA family protein